MNVMSDIKVIGIDPAPSKKSTVFDGDGLIEKKFSACTCIGTKIEETNFYSCKPKELINLINYIKGCDEKILICWDAPLTGPDFNNIKEFKNSKKVKFYEGNFSDRKIEKWLRDLIHEIKENGNPKRQKKDSAKGVSVSHYSGCTHWTISQYIFGLPRIGKNNSEKLPFELVKCDECKNHINHHIVEVHPAVAMYFWLGCLSKYKNFKKGDLKEETSTDRIKKIWDCSDNKKCSDNDNGNYNNIKEVYCKIFPNCENQPCPENDDQLDALVAYMLGKAWLKKDSKETLKVKLFGDENTGAMLLPDSIKCDKEDCKRDFETFLSNFKK